MQAGAIGSGSDAQGRSRGKSEAGVAVEGPAGRLDNLRGLHGSEGGRASVEEAEAAVGGVRQEHFVAAMARIRPSITRGSEVDMAPGELLDICFCNAGNKICPSHSSCMGRHSERGLCNAGIRICLSHFYLDIAFYS